EVRQRKVVREDFGNGRAMRAQQAFGLYPCLVNPSAIHAADRDLVEDDVASDVDREWMLGQAHEDDTPASAYKRQRRREGGFVAGGSPNDIHETTEGAAVRRETPVGPDLPRELKAVFGHIDGGDRGGTVCLGRRDGQQADGAAAKHEHVGTPD